MFKRSKFGVSYLKDWLIAIVDPKHNDFKAILAKF